MAALRNSFLALSAIQNSKEIAISDSTGFFKLIANNGDFLLIKNIIYHDTVIKVLDINMGKNIILSEKYNSIKEVKVYGWGNSYEDFKRAFIDMTPEVSIADRLALPKQDPNYIPFYMDDKALNNPLYIFVSPVSFLYYKYNHKEKIIRKAYYHKRNKSKLDYINNLLSKENIMRVSHCSEKEFENFSPYLIQNFNCNHNCTEIEVLSEISFWWQKYRAEYEKKD